MVFFIFLFFWSFYIYLSCFNKKLLSLLSLEMLMITLISTFFFLLSNFSNSFMHSYGFFFLILMVLDSVLGLSLLIFSSRLSEKCSLIFF